MSNLLQVQGLSSGYGEAVVLTDINFELAQGETLALLGRNGTGKTTLMDTIIGVTQHHAGSIKFSGKSIERLASYERAIAGIGWVPQERNIFKSLTVDENLTAVAMSLKPDRDFQPWTPNRVYELFPRLAERKKNLGTQLSGGEQQMLALGRALVLNPRILLLDEPLEGLAPIIVEELLNAVYRVTREEGLSAIIVEQHPQAILAISHQAVVLDHGTLVFKGKAETLSQDPALLERLLGIARSESNKHHP